MDAELLKHEGPMETEYQVWVKRLDMDWTPYDMGGTMTIERAEATVERLIGPHVQTAVARVTSTRKFLKEGDKGEQHNERSARS